MTHGFLTATCDLCGAVGSLHEASLVSHGAYELLCDGCLSTVDRDIAQQLEHDDPRCACGVYLSEHPLCGCPEGFQTEAQWAADRKRIYQRVAMVDEPYIGDEDEF